ncbi:MerR family transcriptional regulator [Cellulomonas fimi]|uniref:MerR family transcriptional regulator n=1 Tax=Cellulomonas fimi TaxID=1708 RepID=A0A7Y0M0Q3_CELFI|nr:MerR family transcriptional regulator [Cellulomonas fimi]NMR21701.1 MerR family transcriptional regulator [Cellulomonas fimi]
MTNAHPPQPPANTQAGDLAQPGAATLQIGAVAERTGLSLRTLRHYDEVGLLTPSARSEGGFRLYTSADVERLLLIRRMKPLGFSLEEMADLLDTVEALHRDSGDAAARQRLAEYLGSAEERRDKLLRTLTMADEFITLLRAT